MKLNRNHCNMTDLQSEGGKFLKFVQISCDRAVLLRYKDVVSHVFPEICCNFTAALGKVCGDQVIQYKYFCLCIGYCSTSLGKILDVQSKELPM